MDLAKPASGEGNNLDGSDTFEEQASFTFPNKEMDFDYTGLSQMKTNAKVGGNRTSSIDIPVTPRYDDDKFESKHRRIQALSELAMDLYRQLRVVRDTGKQTGPGTTFQHQLVGSVLKSSNTFVTLLSYFPESNALSPLSPAESRENTSSSSLDASKDEPNSESGPADLTTVLQLLACYMRLIHLHSVMHSHFLEYLLNFSQTDQNDIPPVFPGMQVDGVSLDSFGTFQVMFVLQASLRVLGDVEIMLGLPEDCRIGKRKSGVKGVLGASVSAGFINAVMREEAWREKKLLCVRKRLESLWKVLERHESDQSGEGLSSVMSEIDRP